MVVLVGVVVHEPDGHQKELRVAAKLLDDHYAGRPGTGNEDSAGPNSGPASGTAEAPLVEPRKGDKQPSE